MSTGTVIEFARGVGRVQPDDGGDALHVHDHMWRAYGEPPAVGDRVKWEDGGGFVSRFWPIDHEHPRNSPAVMR